MFIMINGTPVEVVIIKKNNKNIYFRVKEDLKLYVTCNYLCTQKYLKKLLNDNLDSITKMYTRVLKNKQKDNYFWYLGKNYIVVFKENIKNVYFENNYIYAKNEKMLDKFYQNECLKIFTNEVNRCKECFTNLPAFTLKLRKMSTRWGVCNRGNNTVTLNTELLKKEIHLLDYVIIHELCHFYQANHSAKFWALVENYYPNYKLARKELRD